MGHRPRRCRGKCPQRSHGHFHTMCALAIFGVQETVLLVNHALARGTPDIFVIFVVSWGSSSKALVLLVRMQIRHFRHFRQNPLFLAGQKHGLPKAPFSGPRNFPNPTTLLLVSSVTPCHTRDEGQAIPCKTCLPNLLR